MDYPRVRQQTSDVRVPLYQHPALTERSNLTRCHCFIYEGYSYFLQSYRSRLANILNDRQSRIIEEQEAGEVTIKEQAPREEAITFPRNHRP